MILLVLLLLIILALIIAVTVQQYLRRKRAVVSPYTEGLALLLDGRIEEAITKLRQTVTADTNNVDAYLRLADLYYDKGELDRALQIERALMARRGLQRDQELKIYTRLGRTYLKTGQTERAILIFEELIKLDKKNIHPYETLLELYCQAGKWEECAALVKQLSKIQTDRHRLALYLAEVGRALALKNRPLGIDYLKRALKIDPKCTAALFTLGSFSYQESQFKPAIDYWRQILDYTPDYGFLVLRPLERAYLDAGNFSLVIPVYEKLLKKTAGDPSVSLALAQIYDKKGETAKAIELLRKATDAKSDTLLPGLRLLAIQLKTGEVDKSIKDLEHLSGRLESHRFQCRICRFQSEEFLWLCPQCHEWETFSR